MKKLLNLFLLPLLISAFLLVGCKADKATEGRLTDLETKLAETQRKLSEVETEQKKTIFEMGQVKELVTKLGNVVVDMQRAPVKKSAAPAVKAPAKKKSGRR